MRWFSVNKYEPIKDCLYLVRRACGTITLATLEGFLDESVWITQDHDIFDDFPVTHFCAISPIEIEA